LEYEVRDGKILYPIIWIIKKEESMSSHKQLVSDIERQSVRVRINLYKQMKEQLLFQMKLYQRERKKELAKLISESI
jgi:hypothetical protein